MNNNNIKPYLLSRGFGKVGLLLLIGLFLSSLLGQQTDAPLAIAAEKLEPQTCVLDIQQGAG